MKKLISLKGVEVLSPSVQKVVNGGGNACGIGCAGKPYGARCYASANCLCEGLCIDGCQLI